METKSPAVLLYTSDFLTGTMLMSDEQVGKYIRALCYQHQQGHLTEEDMKMICKTLDEKVYEKFSKDKDGKYFNKRMDLEIEKRNNFSKSRSANRKGKPNKSRDTNKSHMNNISQSYEEHMDNDNDNDNEDININNIYSFIEENFGRTLSSVEYEEIGNWEDNDLTRYAIKQAILNGKYNIKYIQTILKSYKLKKITTIQQAQEDESSFKEKKDKQYKPYKTSSERTQAVFDEFLKGDIE